MMPIICICSISRSDDLYGEVAIKSVGIYVQLHLIDNVLKYGNSGLLGDNNCLNTNVWLALAEVLLLFTRPAMSACLQLES